LSIGAVVDRTAAIVKTGVRIVGNVFKQIGGFLARGFQWVTTKVYQTFVDPYDIEELDNSAGYKSHQVDLFAYHVVHRPMWTNDGIGDYEFTQNMNMLVGHDPVRLDLFSGTILARNFSAESYSDGIVDGYMPYCDWEFKPRPLNYNLCKKVLFEDYAFADYTVNVVDMVARLNLLKGNPDLYLTPSVSELELLCGFQCGYFVTRLLIDLMMQEYNYMKEDPDDPDGLMLTMDPGMFNQFLPGLNPSPHPSKVTNESFVRVVSGWEPLSGQFKPYCPYVRGDGSYWIPDITRFMVLCLGESLRQQAVNPIDFHFFPYSKEARFPDPTYRIRTDVENIEAAEKFLAIAFVAVIAVAATVAVGVTLSRIATRMTMRANGIARAIENKLAGGTATKADMRLFRRARLKMRLASALTGRLNGGAKAITVPDFNIGTVDVQDLKKRIG
jgi:hypothetical protein